MTASRSDCSRDPADEIPAVADDDDMGEEASSPKFTEVLFERPNMLFCTVFEPRQHCIRTRAASRFAAFKIKIS